MKKNIVVFVFIFLQLFIVLVWVAYSLLAAINRGGSVENIAANILLIGLLPNFTVIVLLAFERLSFKLCVIIMSAATVLTLLLAVYGSAPINNYISALKVTSHENIRVNTKVKVLSDEPIVKNGRTIGIRVELKVILPEAQAFTSYLSVQGFDDRNNSVHIPMRMLSCGDMEPIGPCRFYSHNENGEFSFTFVALTDEDGQIPHWPSHVGKRKIKKIYVELIPVSGSNFRSIKNHEAYQALKDLLNERAKKLPLKLLLISQFGGAVLTTVHFKTLHSYNLREMFINSGRENVLKEILPPIETND